ncbi:hypothetical protein C8R47DRAFT_1073486 [Mycena vitilis]|nr:hypothetical protein C8R47DRAFT_1073486 [Mycena vitilis]
MKPPALAPALNGPAPAAAPTLVQHAPLGEHAPTLEFTPSPPPTRPLLQALCLKAIHKLHHYLATGVSQFLPHWFRRSHGLPRVHTIGLLGTTDLPDDWWIATDFLVWKELLADSYHSTWFSAVNLAAVQTPVILGDPFADRLDFALDITGITSSPDSVTLKLDFLDELREMVPRLRSDDALVLVICSHGDEENGNVVLGGGIQPTEQLKKAHVEKLLRGCKVPQDRVYLVSTACYSGSWVSDRWTLLAAAAADQESNVMRASGSQQCRGGFFAYAALAEQADEHGLTAPFCEEVKRSSAGGHDGYEGPLRHPPVPGDLHLSTPRALESPRRSLPEAYDLMQALRLRIDGIYKSTPFTLAPKEPNPKTFPLCDFGAFLARFKIVSPSPPLDNQAGLPNPTSSTGDSDTLFDTLSEKPLFPDELEELNALALAFNAADFPSTSSHVPLITACARWAVNTPFTPSELRVMLSRLRYHKRASRRAAAIAKSLGWTLTVPVERWRNPTGLARVKEAEAAGAKIRTSFLSPSSDGAWVGAGQPRWRVPGPAQWLAQMWVDAGRPAVKEEDWETAVRYAQSSLDENE